MTIAHHSSSQERQLPGTVHTPLDVLFADLFSRRLFLTILPTFVTLQQRTAMGKGKSCLMAVDNKSSHPAASQGEHALRAFRSIRESSTPHKNHPWLVKNDPKMGILSLRRSALKQMLRSFYSSFSFLRFPRDLIRGNKVRTYGHARFDDKFLFTDSLPPLKCLIGKP